MKRIITLLVVLAAICSILIIPVNVSANDVQPPTDLPLCPCPTSLHVADMVDIGNPATETSLHSIERWGPIEPATHGGTWGGFDATGENCRVAWRPPAGTPWARFQLSIPNCEIGCELELRVLQGQANDSFKVYINDELRYVYAAQQTGTENWLIHHINIVGMKGRLMVKIEATGPKWSGWDTYGQLAVDWAKLWTCCCMDYVNIGNPGSEAGHSLAGWGPIEPTTNGGGWGGIAPGTGRVVWAGDGSDQNYASLQLYAYSWDCPPAKSLLLRVLDGLGDDSYDVYVNNQLVASIAAPHPGKSSSEEWFTDVIDLTTVFPNGLKSSQKAIDHIKIKLVSTAQPWQYFNPYGQVAFDWIALCPGVPAD